MDTVGYMTNHDQAAKNRQVKEKKRAEWAAYLEAHPVEVKERDPANVAAEDEYIRQTREAVPLH